MDMEADYMNIMIESLEKKRDVLGRIIEMNRQQKLLLSDPNLLPEDMVKRFLRISFYDGMKGKRQGSPNALTLPATPKKVRPEAIRAESEEKSRASYCP